MIITRTHTVDPDQVGDIADAILSGRARFALDDGSGYLAPVPSGLNDLLMAAAEQAVRSRTVTVSALPDMVSPATAAKTIGITRQRLMELINDGAIPTHEVRGHLRLRADDVRAYAARRLEAIRIAEEQLKLIAD